MLEYSDATRAQPGRSFALDRGDRQLMFSSRLRRAPAATAWRWRSRAPRGRAARSSISPDSNPTRAGFVYPPDLLAPWLSRHAACATSRSRSVFRRRGRRSRPISRGAACDDPAERVVLTASTSEAYSLLFKLLCDPGDACWCRGQAIRCSST